MKKNLVVALIIIFLAVYLIVSKIGFAPAFPIFTLAFTALFLYTMIEGFIRLHFFEAFMSLAILGCIHDKRLGITALTPWTLIVAAIMLAIAFDMLFKGVKRDRKMKKEKDFGHGFEGGSYVEDIADGEQVRVDNHFGATSKYVNSERFMQADIENSFGECRVYFNNAILAGNTARICAENSFGETHLYLPRTWRVVVKQNCAFGSVNIHGSGSTVEGAPAIELIMESNFGQIDVYFE